MRKVTVGKVLFDKKTLQNWRVFLSNSVCSNYLASATTSKEKSITTSL
jgi:hypothetical protein